MKNVFQRTFIAFLSFFLAIWVVGNAQIVRALPCSETYSQGCSCGSASGSQTCHKKGQSPNGQGGPQCSWGAGSYCDGCKCSAPQQSSQPQAQQQQQSGCSNRSCPGNECNDGTKYGADPCTPQASCADRDREACNGHGGPKGSSAQASSQQPVGGSCPAGSSNGCAGRNPGDVFHIAGTCLKCVKIGSSCGRDEVSCPADLSKVPAVTTGESGYGQLPDPIPVTGDASTCNKNSFPGCVGEGGGYMLVSDNSSGVCQQCVMAGNGACARTYVMCPGAKRVAQSGQCAAGSADGCYGKNPGETITVGKDTLTCVRSGASGPCQRALGAVPVKSQEPQKSSPPAASQAVPIPTNSGNKVDYCFAHSMVYVGGCVDKCLPETKTAIEWTTAICGYTEQQQQDIANKLKGKDRDAELAALAQKKKEVEQAVSTLAQKKKEVEQAVSTQNTLDTYNTGPSASRNCKNRGGTLLDCGDSGKVCFGDTEVTQGQKDAECAKLKERQDKAKGTGKNWLDNLMSSGGDGQECKKDSDCVSNLCRQVSPRYPGDVHMICFSYSAAKDAATADVKSGCQSPSVLGTCTGTQNSRFYVPQPVCIPPGSNLDNACASLAKRMQAAEDKGLNSFDWKQVVLKNGDLCTDAALCQSNICDILPSDVGKPDAKKVCLMPGQLELRNRTAAAPMGSNLAPGLACVKGQCQTGSVCDMSNSTKVTPQNEPIGVCAKSPDAKPNCQKGSYTLEDCQSALGNKGIISLVKRSCVQIGQTNCWKVVNDNDPCGTDFHDEKTCNDSIPSFEKDKKKCAQYTNNQVTCLRVVASTDDYACQKDKGEYETFDACDGASKVSILYKDIGYKCQSFTKGYITTCWHFVKLVDSQAPVVACDVKKLEYDTPGACEAARGAATAVPSQDTTTKCESFVKDTKTQLQCWKINTVAAPLPDLCKQTGWSCPWFSFCETVNRTQIRCSSMFGHGGSLTVLSFGDQCKNSGRDSCTCSSRKISENDWCTPSGTECASPKIIFENKCYDPKDLPAPKVDGSCLQIQGAPACPVGYQCLKKAGDEKGRCTSISAGPESFTTGDECAIVGQACMGAKISICQHSKPGDSSSPLKCIEVPMANEDAECNPAYDKPCSGRGTICALRADNKYRCVVQGTTVFSIGDQCFNPGSDCSQNGTVICKPSPTDPKIYTCQTKTQQEFCSTVGRYPTKDDCKTKNSAAVDSRNAVCTLGDDNCYTLQQLVLDPGVICRYASCQCKTLPNPIKDTIKNGETCPGKLVQPTPEPIPISKDKLCDYFHCPNWGTWCEVVDVERQLARCVWGIGGGGKGETQQVLQPGQTCGTDECACTVSPSNIKRGKVCGGS